MTNLTEIQEAIEKLAPEDLVALLEWLDESDAHTLAVIRERVRQIRAGEAILIDGDQVQEEMRQLARQIVNQWNTDTIRKLEKSIVAQFTFMERQQSDSSKRSKLQLIKFGKRRLNSEKSNPTFGYAEYMAFHTPFITSSKIPRSSSWRWNMTEEIRGTGDIEFYNFQNIRNLRHSKVLGEQLGEEQGGRGRGWRSTTKATLF
jgi:hypothetical protein